MVLPRLQLLVAALQGRQQEGRVSADGGMELMTTKRWKTPATHRRGVLGGVTTAKQQRDSGLTSSKLDRTRV